MVSWNDILESVVLICACILGLSGNMVVLNLSLKIHSYARKISLVFCAITCADAVVCAVRLPVTVYLTLSVYEKSDVNINETTTTAAAFSVTRSKMNVEEDSSSSVAWTTEQLEENNKVEMACEVNVCCVCKALEESNRHSKSFCLQFSCRKDPAPDNTEFVCAWLPACMVLCVMLNWKIWAASGAILYTIVFLHLLVGMQRLCIIFSFPTYRKLFTRISTVVLLAASWLLGIAIVYTPLRALGMRSVQAGRGTCRVSRWVPQELVWAQSVETALVCTVPVMLTAVFYSLILRRVWKAREHRHEALGEYNRAIVVTITRVVTLTLTYFPFSLVLILEAKSGFVPDTVHRYISFLYCAQSVISPFVTLHDNDFRQKLIQSKNGHSMKQARNGSGGGEAGPSTVPQIEVIARDGGQNENFRNSRPRRERIPPPLERALSFFTSSDLRTMRYSNDVNEYQ